MWSAESASVTGSGDTVTLVTILDVRGVSLSLFLPSQALSRGHLFYRPVADHLTIHSSDLSSAWTEETEYLAD
jgi:hypothetical protein